MKKLQLIYLFSLCIVCAAAADPITKVTSSMMSPSAPTDFRCDNMIVHSKPNTTECVGHVVIRRLDMLICCEKFISHADANWLWQNFTCTGDVRAQHMVDNQIETIWASVASFSQQVGDLTLTGKPILQHGTSILEGERIVIHTHAERAHIFKPRGTMDRQILQNVPTPAHWLALLHDKLPNTCPITPFKD